MEFSTFTISDIDDSRYYCGEYVICNICYQDNWELVPNKFDIDILKPFEDKVLVRNDENQRWLPAFWGYKVIDGFITTFGWCKYCIPYNGNEILFKTNNDCDDFYKTWEITDEFNNKHIVKKEEFFKTEKECELSL